MTSRRDLLRSLGLGAAAVGAGFARPASAAERSADLRAFARAGDGRGAPWWLIHPVRAGSSIGKGWHLIDLGRVEKGASVLTLRHRDGREVAVHLCARRGAPRGLAHSALFDLVSMDGRNADAPTPEDLGRALMGLARRVQRNELGLESELADAGWMMSHAERVEAYGPAALLGVDDAALAAEIG
jgi:hypothetical protein